MRRSDIESLSAIMKFADLTDKSLLVYHESLRKQVVADARLGGRFRLIGESGKRYAAELQAEMTRRQIRFSPIEWT
jgi:hypothetical protein